MAGDWLKVEICTPDKPEVIGIADILGIPPAQSFGCLFMIWRWFDQHTTAGNASFVTKVTVDRLAGNAGFADAMVRVGWLVVNADGTVSLPHFDRHNGETAKQRALTAKRVAKSKSKSNDIANAASVTASVIDALPREEKRREDIKIYDAIASLSPESSGNPPEVAKLPPCPHKEIIALWRKHLPTLTQPRIWEGARKESLRCRWTQASTPSAFNEDGYSTLESGLAWWDSFFAYIRTTKLAVGFEDKGRYWKPDLEWVVKQANFQKIIDGRYDK